MTSFWNNGLYSRGFLITKKGANVSSIPLGWEKASICDDFQIYYDTRNKISFYKHLDSWVFMCGSYCMDALLGIMDMEEIVSQLTIKLCLSEKAFYNHLAQLNGRFVVLYGKGNEIKFLNDATASRSVFYSTQQFIIASHYNLIQSIVKQPFSKVYELYIKINEQRVKNGQPRIWVLPGDYTPYEKIKILLPNHYVSIENLKVPIRFYPLAAIQETNLEYVCDNIAKTISDEAKFLTKHYHVFQSLTRGVDSRITLSATKDVKEKINYFCYKNKTKANDYSNLDRAKNFDFAKHLCEKEKLNFTGIIISDDALDKELYEILKQNHYHQSCPQLLINYSRIFTEGDIHLRSNLIEICRDAHTDIQLISQTKEAGKIFAKLMGYREKDDGFDQIANIFQEYYINDYVGQIFDYSATHLFYWEHKCGQWVGSAVIGENDITNDTFQLFNCRKILDLSLSLPLYYKNRNIIYDKIIEKLWPELADYGIPNKDERLYSLIDKNKLSRIPILGNVRYVQGNLNDTERIVSAIFEPQLYGISFGFGSNKIAQNDFCGIVCDFAVVKDNSYQFSFTIKTFWQQAAGEGAIYEIIVDNRCVYSLSTKSYYDINQIDYCFKANEDKKIEVIVRLRAPKDYVGIYYNGTIDVLCMNLKRDFGNEYEHIPIIIDSFYQKKAKLPITRMQNRAVPTNEINNKSNICLLKTEFENEKSIGIISKQRDKIFNYDRTRLTQEASVLDIENLEGVKSGKYKFIYKGIHFDCFITIKQKAPLYVILNGSKTNPPPIFKRWSWYNTFNGTTINISDPSYIENEKLYLGWYYGTSNINYRQLVAEIVLKFAHQLKIKNDDIYFYGSSGGGAAAIHCAGLIEGSTAMVINPQIFLNLYHYAKTFKSITGIDLSMADKWHREDLSYYLLNSPKSNFLIVSNIDSPDDALQIQNLSKRMGMEFSYGINRIDNVGVWLYDVYTQNTPLHNAQEDQTLYFAIDYLAKTLKNKKDWAEIEEIYFVISELWRAKSMLLDKMKNKE